MAKEMKWPAIPKGTKPRDYQTSDFEFPDHKRKDGSTMSADEIQGKAKAPKKK